VNNDEHIFALALDAVNQSDTNVSANLYDQIIRQLSAVLNGDQKEIALALQSLAKRIESQKDADSAFRFKQRSCETFLLFNMEARRSGRNPVPSATAVTGSHSASDELATKAKTAVTTNNSADAERLFTEIIEELKRRHKDDQREIAAQLQLISKKIETEDAQAAFAFKQRSCELMLRISMASRRPRT